MNQHLYRSRVSYAEDIGAYNALVQDLVDDEDISITDYSKYDILVPTPRNDTDWFLGVYMNLPLFTGFDKKSKLEQAQTELIQLEESNAFDLESLSYEINKHLLRVNSLYRSIHIGEQTVKQSQRALEEVSHQYFAGEVLLSELRDSSDVALHAAIKQQVLLGVFRQELFQLLSLAGLQDFYTKQDARDLLFASLEQHFLEKGFPLPSTK